MTTSKKYSLYFTDRCYDAGYHYKDKKNLPKTAIVDGIRIQVLDSTEKPGSLFVEGWEKARELERRNKKQKEQEQHSNDESVDKPKKV